MNKSINWFFFIVTALVMVLALVIGYGPAESQPPKPPLPGMPPPASPSQPVKMVFSIFQPPLYYTTILTERYCKLIETESKGTIKIDFHHSGTLVGGREQMAAVSRGDIDMTMLALAYHAGTIPIFDLDILPFLWDNIQDQMNAQETVLDKLYAEKLLPHGIVYLFSGSTGMVNMSGKKPFRKPDDMKGLIFSVPAAIIGKMVAACGGSFLPLPSTEVYQAFQKGTIDAGYTTKIIVTGRKLWEVAEYFTVCPTAAGTGAVVINKKTWDKLSPDQQAAVKKASDWANKEWKRLTLEDEDKALVKIKESGMKIVELTKEEVSVFRNKSKPIREEWLIKVPEARDILVKLGKL